MIRGTTRIAAVLGWPIAHSRSPQMLNAAFASAAIDAAMVPLAVPPEELATVVRALRAVRAVGASVTIPHKLAVVALCDRLSDDARAIGAVNCLELGDEVVGHNTDAGGFVDSMRAAGCPEPRHVVILGAGGAARGVAYGLRSADTVDVIARRPETVDWTATWGTVRFVAWTADQLRAAFERADLVVDCTSISMTADEAAAVAAFPLEALPRSAWVTTVTYHHPPELLVRARARGHATLDGRGMLVHQGARAFTIWTGQPAPVDVMTRALDAALS